jgi:hypothetical protein
LASPLCSGARLGRRGRAAAVRATSVSTRPWVTTWVSADTQNVFRLTPSRLARRASARCRLFGTRATKRPLYSSSPRAGTGTGAPSARADSIQASTALLTWLTASATVSPAAAQPGRSGTRAVHVRQPLRATQLCIRGSPAVASTDISVVATVIDSSLRRHDVPDRQRPRHRDRRPVEAAGLHKRPAAAILSRRVRQPGDTDAVRSPAPSGQGIEPRLSTAHRRNRQRRLIEPPMAAPQAYAWSCPAWSAKGRA